MMRDLTDKVFGALTALSPTSDRYRGSIVWKCICTCGRIAKVTSVGLVAGNTKSCGCRATVVKHGHSRRSGARKLRTPEYQTWEGMKQRCHNPRFPRFKDWGGRGIIVCDRWRDDFKAFLEDMGARPSSGHSIDRINNDGNYEPSNCRWATTSEQSANKRPVTREVAP